jgi:hypothetical protein
VLTKSLPVTIRLPAGVKRQLYVNTKRTKANNLLKAETSYRLPEIIVRNDDPYDGVTFTHCDEVAALGVFRFKSAASNGGPLTPEGPYLWVETEAELELTIL